MVDSPSPAPAPPAPPPQITVNTGSDLPWWLHSMAGAVAAAAVCWLLWHPRDVPIEKPLPAVVQKDGSVIIARRPDTTVKIQHELPKGTTAEREEHIGILPPPMIVKDTIPVPASPGSPAHLAVKVDTIQPPAVELDLTLVRNADGTHRIVASSLTGKVLAEKSVDVPLGPGAAAPRVLKWVAGVKWAPIGNTYGVFVGRTIAGPLYADASVTEVSLPAPSGSSRVSGVSLQVGVGIRF
jgi:hypothetical protein